MSWTWDAVCEDPQLQDLPYNLELNGNGELIMNAVKILHAFLVYEIQRHLMQLGPEGFSPPEFPIQTSDGVRSPDVVWISSERRKRTLNESAASIAPEICMEVISPGNSLQQIQKKGRLYLQAEALEFWICDEKQKISFYNKTGEQSHSLLFPDFPRTIKL